MWPIRTHPPQKKTNYLKCSCPLTWSEVAHIKTSNSAPRQNWTHPPQRKVATGPAGLLWGQRLEKRARQTFTFQMSANLLGHWAKNLVISLFFGVNLSEYHPYYLPHNHWGDGWYSSGKYTIHLNLGDQWLWGNGVTRKLFLHFGQALYVKDQLFHSLSRWCEWCA